MKTTDWNIGENVFNLFESVCVAAAADLEAWEILISNGRKKLKLE